MHRMNYLAHAVRFLDRPEFVAGTAVPDWLSAADRKVRLRPKHRRAVDDSRRPALAEIAAGVHQHLQTTAGFMPRAGLPKSRANSPGCFATPSARTTDSAADFWATSSRKC